MKNVIKMRKLPKGAKIKLDIRDSATGEEEKDAILTFQKMDGMYGQRRTKNFKLVIFKGEFIKEGEFYVLAKKNGDD